jgi:hypothetical protein
VKRTIGILIVALFLAIAMGGNAYAGGCRGGHKPRDESRPNKNGDKKDKNENEKQKKQHEKKRKNKRKHAGLI